MEKRLLRLPKVMDKTGLCKSAVYALPDFPKPIKIGNVAAWVENEIDAWIDRRIAASRGGYVGVPEAA